MRIKIFGRIIAVPLWAKYALLAFIAAAFVLAGFLIDMQRKSGALEIGSSVDRFTGRSGPAQTNPPDSSALPGTSATPSAATPEPDLKTVTVYIVGAVVTPDVYELPEGSILNDLVKTAAESPEVVDLGGAIKVIKPIGTKCRSDLVINCFHIGHLVLIIY